MHGTYNGHCRRSSTSMRIQQTHANHVSYVSPTLSVVLETVIPPDVGLEMKERFSKSREYGSVRMMRGVSG